MYRLVLTYLQDNSEEIVKNIRKLLNPKIKSNLKRHILRFHLGDYITCMREISIENTIREIKSYNLEQLPDLGTGFDEYYALLKN